MVKIKLPKNPHGNILNKGKKNLLRLKLTWAEKIELEVNHISKKTDVSL